MNKSTYEVAKCKSMYVCESVKRKAQGTVGVWAAGRDEQKKQGRGAVHREWGFDWVGGWRLCRGEVLGVEKGSSLKASLRYSWSELGFHLAWVLTSSWEPKDFNIHMTRLIFSRFWAGQSSDFLTTVWVCVVELLDKASFACQRRFVKHNSC